MVGFHFVLTTPVARCWHCPSPRSSEAGLKRSSCHSIDSHDSFVQVAIDILHARRAHSPAMCEMGNVHNVQL